jgi:hypothetical protein
MKMYFVLVRRKSKRIGGRDPMAWNGPPSRLTSHGACELEVALGVEDRRVRRLSARRACVILQKKKGDSQIIRISGSSGFINHKEGEDVTREYNGLAARPSPPEGHDHVPARSSRASTQ